MTRPGRLLAAATVIALVGIGGVLVGRRSAEHHDAAPAAHALYQCAMHPQIVRTEPGLCPICRMPLQRVDEPAPAGPGAPAPDATGVPGHAPFTLSAERQQLIGVTTAAVERRPLEVEIRTAGRVAYDPALYQAIVEYREALRSRGLLGAGAWVGAREGSDALVRGAALRLRQQGVSEDQLRELEKRGGDLVNLLLPGRTAWIYAQVYEAELALVHPGQRLVVTAPALPGRTFDARVVAVDAILDPTTRSARVRALVEAPDGALRPQTFVDVLLVVPLGERVAVPASAILDTGEHRIAFVVGEGGRFEPRSLALGREAGGWYEVESGVHPGERVVTSANFLIDSESRVRAALAAFGGAPAGGDPSGDVR